MKVLRKKPVIAASPKPKRQGPAPVPESEDLFSDEPEVVATPAKKGKKSQKIATDSAGVPILSGETKVVSPSELQPNKWNMNEESDFVYEKLKASIKKFGFTESITVRSSNENGPLGHYEIIGGEHRWKAVTELGMPKVRINDVGMMTDANLKMFMIVLNETKGKANNDQMAVVLSELSKDGIDMSVLPLDEAEIKSLISMGDFDWNNTDVTTDLSEGGGSDDDEESGGTEWVGLEDVLDLDGLKELDWKKDETYAKRLKQVMLLARVAPKSPWQVLDLLISTYYKSVKKTEELPVDEELEEGDEEESEDE